VSARRSDPPAESLALAKLAVSMAKRPGSLVVGFDLAGDEANHPALEHAAALRYVSRYGKPLGLGLTVHAGETPRSGDRTGVQSVWDALRLGATRIGHANAIALDPELMRYIKENRILIEQAPWSNVLTRSVRDYFDHPLPRFLQAQLDVSLSTDDRLVFKKSLTGQLSDLYRYGLVRDWQDIRRMTLAGVHGSFTADRAQREREVLAELARIEAVPAYRDAIAQYLSGR